MSEPRFFIDDALEISEGFRLPDAVAHHMCSVLRKKSGDAIVLFNGRGGEYKATITQVEKKDVIVTITGFDEIERESPLAITLVQGISKGQRMDITLQKAVELGVKHIVPLQNQRSTVQLKGERIQSRMNHWQQVVISACEQCGRNTIPELLLPMSVDEWLAKDTNSRKLLLAPGGKYKLSNLPDSQEATSILVGSEGGLTETEINEATASGYISINIGPRIFRTETAAIVTLSLCQGLWGDLS